MQSTAMAYRPTAPQTKVAAHAPGDERRGALQFVAWRELCLCPICGQALMSCLAVRQEQGSRHCGALLSSLGLDKRGKTPPGSGCMGITAALRCEYADKN